jgi:dihydrofolate reductase
MKAIIAVNLKGFIGLDGTLPWRSSADLQHFKRLTLGNTCIAGFNTLKNLPPLKGRIIWLDKPAVFDMINAKPELYKNVWCIGGAKTYEKYCHLFTELHISFIDDQTIGDTAYPPMVNLNPECEQFHYTFDTNPV